MGTKQFLESYIELQSLINNLNDFHQRFLAIQEWVKQNLRIDELLYIATDTLQVYSSLNGLGRNGYSGRIIEFVRLLPPQNGVIPLPAPMQDVFQQTGTNHKTCMVYPVSIVRNRIQGAVLAFTGKPEEFFKVHSMEMGLICHKLHDLYVINKVSGVPDAVSVPQGTSMEIKRAQALIDLVHYPMFVTDLAGNVLAVNDELLAKCRLKRFSEISESVDLFGNVENKNAILRELKNNRRKATRRITFQTSGNNSMAMNCYATRHNDLVICSLFDIGEFVQVTEELQSALDTQELLNDRLLDSNLVLQKTQASAIRALARLAEFRDHETGEHLKRIGEYTRLLATEVFRRAPYSFQIRMEYAEEIFLSSMLHDIGKVAIPDTILLKPGVLTDDERSAMKNHTVYGWSILSQADQELGEQSFLTLAAQIALSHHERWDGSGYPNQLIGEKIPLSARISAVADVYDALTTERPYKKSWSHEKALAEIKAKSGIHFDPILVDIANSIEKKMLEIRYSFPG